MPFLAVFIFLFIGCEQMEAVLSSTGTYQVRALVNNISLDDCSLIRTDDNVQPYFANYVSDDPDITGLVVFLKDNNGEFPGSRVIYSLESPKSDSEQTAKSDDSAKETFIRVENLDMNLPFLPKPGELPAGYYSIVFRIMGGKRNLFQTEKTFYYLADTIFSFSDIKIYLPDAGSEAALVPTGATVLLEANVDFDSALDPYIVWYDDEKIISEGNFSDNAQRLLLKAPDQNGFLSLRAEVFPVRARHGIAGSSRGISLPVYSKAHSSTLQSRASLLSDNVPGILHWYIFEGDLKDSTAPNAKNLNLDPIETKNPLWIPAGGSYGLATGPGNVYMLPSVSFAETDGGQFMFRFMPVSAGSIFTARIGSSVEMNLSLESKNLVLSLNSPLKTAREVYGLLGTDYVTAVIDFTIQPDHMEAKLNVQELDENGKKQTTEKNIFLAAPVDGKCKVYLGADISLKTEAESTDAESAGAAQYEQTKSAAKEYFTAVWDEFAILSKLAN